VLVDRFAQQFGHIAFIIRGQCVEALRRAAKGFGAVDIGVVVELDEGFEADPELAAIMQQRAVMVRDAPRAGVEVIARLKIDLLNRAAQFLIGVAAMGDQLRPPARC
jgi:hypothetical protein